MPTPRQFNITFFTAVVVVIFAVVVIWETVEFLTDHIIIAMGWK